MRLARLVLLAAGAALLGGCGQKGPLYLPDKGAAVVTPPPPAAPGSMPVTTTNAPTPQESSEPPPQGAAGPRKADKDQDPQMPR